MAKLDINDFKRRYNDMLDASDVFDNFFDDYDEIYGLPSEVSKAMEVINRFILEINPYTQTCN